MGSGKTTVGKKLALQLGYQFLDLDDHIERRVDLSISEIFKKYGEDVFRQLETSALRSTLRKEEVVISTGGGTPCQNDNMTWINKNGKSIFISESPEVLLSRLKNEKARRPLIKNMNDTELLNFIETNLNERMKFYKKAHFKVDTSEALDQILEYMQTAQIVSK